MSALYSKAPDSIEAMAAKLIEEFHVDIKSAKVRIDYIFANATVDDDGVPTGPAITANGYPALGKVKRLGSKDRVMGRGDCEIVLDGDQWPELAREDQIALLDHELEHVQLKRDKMGAFVYDDAHRPRLKLKKHDHQFGWFDAIAERHGVHSQEIKQFLLLQENSGQVYFAFVQAA